MFPPGVRCLCGVIPALVVLATTLPAAEQKPNIVFLLADDLGYRDIGSYGVKDIRTPALDRLAAQGVRFTQFYSNGTECSPMRAAFLTGRYQQRVGGLECAIGSGNVGRYDDAIRLRAIDELGLPAHETSIAQLLRGTGYATALTGKWHLGYGDKFSPNRHGFDHAFYCVAGEMDYFHYLENTPAHELALFTNGKPDRRQGYFTDLVVDEAERFIAANRTQPFFLYVPFTTPHAPYQGPGDRLPEVLPNTSPLWNQASGPPAVYAAMVEDLDRAIARILAALDRNGLTRNTLVVFASDNGGTRSARPTGLREFKSSTFEGGIRVPCIVRWPGVLPENMVSNQVGITMDLTASMLRAAGVSLPAGRKLDGIDILERLAKRQPDIARTLFWRGRRADVTWKGVRDGDLKLVTRVNGAQTTLTGLFDLSRDPGEATDLQSSHAADAGRLAGLLATWEKEVAPSR